MRVVPWSQSYANREVVLVGTTRPEAERWARANKPAGWVIKGITAVRGRPENFTVRFNRGKVR